MINIKEDEFIELTEYLLKNYGINLTQKKVLVEGRLCNVLTQKGYNSFREYLNNVYSDKSKAELTMLINKLTTNHTFFLRESMHFEYLKDNILPYLESSIKDRDLRIWSAGCSSGEEPYTIAMILEDYFDDKNKKNWNKKILATDISTNVLKNAEKGIFLSESVEKLSSTWIMNYFNRIDDDRYEISNKLRNEVIFRNFNLIDKFPFKRKMHVIFCRNVMIYFQRDTKINVINKFYNMTEPGGYFFIGQTESLGRNETDFKYVMPGVYRKTWT